MLRDPAHRLSLLAFAVAALMLFARLGALPLVEPDEGRSSEVGREMMASGSWLVPTINGHVYLDKPAFFFRAVAVSLSLFGVSEAAARLPSAAAGFATLVLLFLFCRPRYGERAAALAVLVGATSLLILAFSRTVILDATLGVFVCAAIFAGCVAEEREGAARRRWYLACAAAVGCATLIKGPVGFLVPALVLLVFSRLDGRRGMWRRCFAPANLLLFFAIVLPWFLGLIHRHPDFFYYGLVEESFHRFTTRQFRRSEPFYYFLPVLFAGTFPWSLLAPESLLLAWRSRRRWSSTDRLFLTWIVVVVFFFSISQSKLPGYVLSAVFALAALTSRLLDRALAAPGGPAARVVRHAAFAAAVLFAALAGLLGLAAGDPALLRLHVAAQSLALGPSRLIPLVVALAALAAVALTGATTRRTALAVASLCLFPPLLLAAGFGPLQQVAELRSSKTLAARLDTMSRSDPGMEIACLECFPSSLPFYLGHPVTICDADGRIDELRSNYLLYEEARHHDPGPGVVRFAELDRRIAATGRPILLLEHEGAGRLEHLAFARGLQIQSLAPRWRGVLLAPRGARQACAASAASWRRREWASAGCADRSPGGPRSAWARGSSPLTLFQLHRRGCNARGLSAPMRMGVRVERGWSIAAPSPGMRP